MATTKLNSVSQYNELKGTKKEIEIQIKELKVSTMVELAEAIDNLKLDGMPTKKAKHQAITDFKSKFENCKFEISIVRYFVIDLDIHADKLKHIANILPKVKRDIKDMPKKEAYAYIDTFIK